MEEKLNLYQKIQKVSMEIMNLEKDMQVGNKDYGYKAVSDKQVTLAVKKAEEKYGIVSIPFDQELINSEIVRKAKGNEETLVFVDNIKMTIRFINLDDPKEFIDVVAFGKGIDSGDKGLGKASTYARKIGLLNAYKIATGEDPDAEKSPETKVMAHNEKLDAIISVCAKNETTKKNILQHFNVGTMDDLSKAQIDTVYNQFKSKNLL